MTTSAGASTPPAGAGWLLRLGARAATSSAFPVLALAGTSAVAEAARRTLLPALTRADPALRLQGTLLLSGAALLLLAALGRAVVLAVAVHSGAARLRTGPGGVRPAVAGLRGLAWAAAVAVVDLLFTVWFWTSLVSSAVAMALGGPGVSLLGAAGVALVLTAGLFLGAATGLWLELALVVSVVRTGGATSAGGEALRTLLARPGFLVGAWFATAFPAGVLAGGIQGLAAGAPGPGPPAAAASGVALLLAALLTALGTLMRLDAFAALVLHREGRLPAPPLPPAPPVPKATLVTSRILEARPVGPMAPFDPGEPG